MSTTFLPPFLRLAVSVCPFSLLTVSVCGQSPWFSACLYFMLPSNCSPSFPDLLLSWMLTLVCLCFPDVWSSHTGIHAQHMAVHSLSPNSLGNPQLKLQSAVSSTWLLPLCQLPLSVPVPMLFPLSCAVMPLIHSHALPSPISLFPVRLLACSCLTSEMAFCSFSPSSINLLFLLYSYWHTFGRANQKVHTFTLPNRLPWHLVWPCSESFCDKSVPSACSACWSRVPCPLHLYQAHSPCLFLPTQFPPAVPPSPGSGAWGTATLSPALRPSHLLWLGTIFTLLIYNANSYFQIFKLVSWQFCLPFCWNELAILYVCVTNVATVCLFNACVCMCTYFKILKAYDSRLKMLWETPHGLPIPYNMWAHAILTKVRDRGHMTSLPPLLRVTM